MTAPDRIWAWTWNLPNNPKHQGWQEWVREDPPKSQDAPEYIRADLHESLQAENERLREALIGTVVALRKIAQPVGPLHSAWDDIFNAEDALK